MSTEEERREVLDALRAVREDEDKLDQEMDEIMLPLLAQQRQRQEEIDVRKLSLCLRGKDIGLLSRDMATALNGGKEYGWYTAQWIGKWLAGPRHRGASRVHPS